MLIVTHIEKITESALLIREPAIPKKHTVFRFEISRLNEKAIGSPDISDGKQSGEGTLTQKNLVFELHGSQFENRATDRATKKFKQRNMSDL